MLHSTGANNPNLKRYVGPDDGKLGLNINNNHWNTSTPEGRQVCAHAFIGKLNDGTIATYQTLPWNHRGWHSGGSANNTHIGVEICEDNLLDSYYFNQVYREAVELCAHLCKTYKLDPLKNRTLICHSEGYKYGIASNHKDVTHWFSKHNKTMSKFRNDVNMLINHETINTSYLVKVTADELNVRKGPSTSYATVSKIKDKGTYTIIKESNGWGLLKSQLGWIRLSYTKRI